MTWMKHMNTRLCFALLAVAALALPTRAYGSAYEGTMAAKCCGLRCVPTGDLRPGMVVEGAEKVSGWKVDGRGWWHARLPAGARCSHLFVNGSRRLRPRVPRRGYLYLEDAPTVAGQCATNVSFRVGEGAVCRNWDFSQIEACVFHDWNMTRLPISAYEPESRTVTCPVPLPKNRKFNSRRWWFLDNVCEALGEPGDWYVSRDGSLVYVPMPGETPDTADVRAAVRETLLEVDGLTNVVIRGVTFAYSGWSMPAVGQTCSQAGHNVAAAVRVTRSRNVRFEGCRFLHLGGWGVEFGPGASDCAVVGCTFADLGAGGVKIGCAREGAEDPANWAVRCAVEDCLIVHGGRFEPAGCGVWIGNANRCRVEHNTIRDMYYSGISVGWTWDQKPSGAFGNRIAFNDISDIGQGRLSDMGGIYLLGKQPGTCVIGNSIRNVGCARFCGFGVYLDQGCNGISAVSNYVENTQGGCFYIQYNTSSNIVADNVFVNDRDTMIATAQYRHPVKKTKPSRFERNVVWWDRPGCRLSLPEPIWEDFLAPRDNVCRAPEGRHIEANGFRSADVSRPAPLCGAGRRGGDTGPLQALGDVPAVFDASPPPRQ